MWSREGTRVMRWETQDTLSGGRVALQAFPPGRVYSSFLSLLGVLLMCLQRLLRDGDHPERLSGPENRLSRSVLILKVWLG